MKKLIWILSLVFILSLTLGITGCGEDKSFTVSFDSNGGTAVASQTVISGEKVTKPANPTKASSETTEYTFDCWLNGTVEYDFNSAVTSDLTLTARWTETALASDEYTVTFNSNGGTAVASQKVKEGEKASKPSNPTKANSETVAYAFDTWLNGTVEYDFNSAVTADLTLTARWIEMGAPVITINGESQYTVAAGEELALPQVTAVDYNGAALELDIEDDSDVQVINEGVFCSKIAGTHSLSYYCYDDNGLEAEEFITVVVNPASAETEVEEALKNPANLYEYGTYSENFSEGRKSPYFKALGDAKNAAYIEGTSDAISGNSLIINIRKLVGSAGYALFGQVIQDYVHRGEQVTYTISFDYKPINADGCFNGLYFSPSYDTDAGSMGKDTNLGLAEFEAGKVYHFEETYSRFVFPDNGNCYLRFFNYNPKDDTVDSFVAIDNIVISAKKESQITYVVPETDDLLQENGFTWDFESVGGTFTNSTFMSVDEIDVAEAKEAIKASDLFGSNVVHVTGSGSHQFTGLNKNNVITGKVLKIELYYYAVDDLDWVIYMGINGANPTIQGNHIVRETISGNIKKITTSFEISSIGGENIYNLYGGSNNDNIYVGRVVAYLCDPVVLTEEIEKPSVYVPTVDELKADGGFTWNMVDKFMDLGQSKYLNVEAMTNTAAKEAILAKPEWFGSKVLYVTEAGYLAKIGKNNVEAGYYLNIDFYFYDGSNSSVTNFIIMGDGSQNFTSNSSFTIETVEGNYKHFKASVLLKDEMLQLDQIVNFYSGTFDMYIGKFVISLTKPAVQYDPATVEELSVEGGFTFDMHSHGEKFDVVEGVKVNTLDDSVKQALSGSAYVGEYVIPVIRGAQNNMMFTGLDSKNVPNNKTVKIEMIYYAITDASYKLYNGQAKGDTEDLGNGFKKWTLELERTSGFKYISFYEGSFNLYVCSVKVTMKDYSDTPPTTDPEAIKLYQSGTGFAGGTSKVGYTISDSVDLGTAKEMGLAKKIVIENSADGYIEIRDANTLEGNVEYTIKMAIYNVDWDGNIFLMIDDETPNRHFLPFENKTGYYLATKDYTFGAKIRWISFYTNTVGESGTFYVGDIIAVNKATGEETLLYNGEDAFAGGEQKDGYKEKGAFKVYDVVNPSSFDGMKNAKRVDITNATGHIEMIDSQGAMKAGKTYTVKVYLYNVNWDGAIFIMINDGQNRFLGLENKKGYYVATYEHTFDGDTNWICLYTNTANASGTFYIGDITAVEKVPEAITLYQSGTGFAGGTSKAGYTVSDSLNLGTVAEMQNVKRVELNNISNYIEIINTNGVLKAGVTYTMNMYLYNVDWDGAIFLMINDGNNQFVGLPNQKGYYVASAEFTPAGDSNWMCLYSNTATGFGTFYLGDIKAVNKSTGEVISLYEGGTGFAGGSEKAGFTISDAVNPSAYEGMADTKKIDLNNISNYIEMINTNGLMKAGVTYVVKMYIYNVDWDGAIFLMINDGSNQFLGFENKKGYYVATVEFTPAGDSNWMCLYSNTATGSGTIYIGDITAEEK